LSKTQGALAAANAKLIELEAEVQSAHEVSLRQQNEITRLQTRVKTLQKREKELEEKLRSYESS
jgi:uncharacterized protein YqgV (UPF0045/DUF77 family)